MSDFNPLLDEEYDNKDAINPEYAGFWIRVGAAIIDGFIFVPLVAFEMYNKLTLQSLPLLMLTTLLTILYKPYLEYARGATIGKSALGIKVVNEDYQMLTLNQAIMRFMPWMISYGITFMLSLPFYTGSLSPESYEEILTLTEGSFWSNLSTMYSVVFFIMIIVVAFDLRKQGLHDKIAQTYCIMAR